MMALPPLLAAVVASAPQFVGGIVNAAGSRKERIAAENMTRHIRREDRGWFEADRQSEREYAAGLTRNNRQYQEGERIRDQRNLDIAAKQSVDTRGVDFQKLRSEAIAAGFNPMSVMGTAGMYSTELNRQIVGTGGVSGSGGGGLGTPGGGMYGGGGGNVGNYSPALSTGSFLADAIQRGADTFFNTPPANDPLADALREAISSDTIVKDAQSRNPRQKFGYDLTDVPAYRPDVKVGAPAMARGTPTSGSDEMVNPSSLPIKWGGNDFEPSGLFSDAEAAESRYGEVAGELLGMDSLIYDLGKKARAVYNDRAWHSRGSRVTTYRKPPMYPWPRGLKPDGVGGFR